jgi:ABC-type transporter Mla subunit MlaD
VTPLLPELEETADATREATIRINPMKTDEEEVVEQLEQQVNAVAQPVVVTFDLFGKLSGCNQQTNKQKQTNI